MNFFERQNQTRSLSRRLVLLFILAVLVVVIAVDLVVFSVAASLQSAEGGLTLPSSQWVSVHAGFASITTLSVIGVICLASLYKTATLGGGGGVVARSLGGVRVSAETTDPLQRRLLNVVEEMSIAAGVPMPEVYLLEQESGINAFAAGHGPANAAVAVTRGTLTQLNRAELQGVIAHEFSHILNGDMRLNVRLIGLLFGLLVIALIARTVLRFAPRGRGGGKKGGGIAVVFLAAFAVLIIGYLGLFFGRLIQAAVSRSREALADASAVQFTRDPAGLRAALVKIGAVSHGSHIGNPEVEEVAHMLFAPGMSRLFATHPPLLSRLKALDPNFDPREISEVRARMLAQAQQSEQPRVVVQKSTTAAERLQAVMAPAVLAPASMAGLVGNPGTAHMQQARAIRESLPEGLVHAGRHPDGAQALLLALALDVNATARDRQLKYLAQQLGPQLTAAIGPLLGDVDRLQAQQRMPLVSGAFPALRQLTREQRQRLLSTLNGMLQREGRLSLQSYVLRKLAQVHLRDDLEPRTRVGKLLLHGAIGELQVLFSVLAQYGHTDTAGAQRAYEAGMQPLLRERCPAFAPPANWQQPLDLALTRLDQLAPVPRQQLIEALVRTIAHDGKLTVGETELLRAVCASLHCPLPPLNIGASDVSVQED